eukprot:7148714-Prymnesium_polylepis.1
MASRVDPDPRACLRRKKVDAGPYNVQPKATPPQTRTTERSCANKHDPWRAHLPAGERGRRTPSCLSAQPFLRRALWLLPK